MLIFVVTGLVKGWLVPGWAYNRMLDDKNRGLEAMKAEKDRALELVYKNAEIASRALEAVERRKE